MNVCHEGDTDLTPGLSLPCGFIEGVTCAGTGRSVFAPGRPFTVLLRSQCIHSPRAKPAFCQQGSRVPKPCRKQEALLVQPSPVIHQGVTVQLLVPSPCPG